MNAIAKKSLGLLLVYCCSLSMVGAQAMRDRYLDFRGATTNESVETFIYQIDASPGLLPIDDNLSVLINIGNAQVRIPVADAIRNGITLSLSPSRLYHPSFAKWDCDRPGSHETDFTTFTLSVGDSVLASWIRMLNSGPVYILRNFRVYLTSGSEFTGHFWVVERFSKKASDNLFAANVYTYNASTASKPRLSIDEQVRLTVVDPVWIALTAEKTFCSPKNLIFPTTEELIDQRPIATAENAKQFIESAAPVWKLPFLLPPVLVIKSELNQQEALDRLRSLQRDVAIIAIWDVGSSFSTDRLPCTEKLLAYYLEIIDETSSLRGSVEKNLELVRKKMK